MEIQFIYGAKGGAFPSAVMAAALNAGCRLHINHPFVVLSVESWAVFLHIVWKACAECSHDSRGCVIEKRLPITVNFNGTAYHTKVWYDSESKGLRYVSLD